MFRCIVVVLGYALFRRRRPAARLWCFITCLGSCGGGLVLSCFPAQLLSFWIAFLLCSCGGGRVSERCRSSFPAWFCFGFLLDRNFTVTVAMVVAFQIGAGFIFWCRSYFSRSLLRCCFALGSCAFCSGGGWRQCSLQI